VEVVKSSLFIDDLLVVLNSELFVWNIFFLGHGFISVQRHSRGVEGSLGVLLLLDFLLPLVKFSLD
jgi:hypothetical protein